MNSLPLTTRATLYIVATPIGNLSDLTERARQTLNSVDLIACEDTRHTQKLLQHLGLHKPLISVHDHNERDRIEHIRNELVVGKNIALVSDAGTPLISDPGYALVQVLREEGFSVTPIPGPSALITALSAAGLPTDRFIFEGFLPHKSNARKEMLESAAQEARTLIYYESRHRILASVADMIEVLGEERQACIARELTKTFETWYRGSLGEIQSLISADDNQQKGEFVVMIAGNSQPESSSLVESDRLFRLLLSELPPKKAAAIVSELTGEHKKELYQRALKIKEKL